MARITHYPDYDALAAATAGGNTAEITAVLAMRKAHRDRCAEAGTKMILDFKSPFTHPDTAPAIDKIYKNQLPEQGDATQKTGSLVRVYNGAGKLTGISAGNTTVRQLQFPVAAKLANTVTRAGIVYWLRFNSATASGIRCMAGWGDGALASQRAYALLLSGANALTLGFNGRDSTVVPAVVMGTVYQVAAEVIYAGINSIHRVFLNGVQVGTDVIFDGTAGLPQPVTEAGIGGITGYYSTANANMTTHRITIDDLGVSGRTMAQLVALDWKRNQHRFD